VWTCGRMPSSRHAPKRQGARYKAVSQGAVVATVDELTRYAREIYSISKQIDGYPEVEGTWPLVGSRVRTFLNLRERQTFYEPVSTYEELIDLILINSNLLGAYAPVSACNRLVISFRMFRSAYAAPSGVIPMPTPGDSEVGTHAVAAGFGWSDGGEAVRFKNSWGAGWGNRGYGMLSREYLDRYMVEAWLGRDARVGPTRHKLAHFAEATDDKEFTKVWMLENPRQRVSFRHGDRGHRLHFYETWSCTDAPVELIEVRDGRGMRLGWAHLHHTPGQEPHVSVLKELFVWPAFRRRGYGTVLESAAAERARHRRASSIEMLFHEVDAKLRNRAAGQGLASKTGYTLQWRRSRRPNVSAVGVRSLL
jgi:GNAT superfamily N-acetyltransferase